MRTFLFLCFQALAFSQIIRITGDNDLRRYLNLNDAQLDQLRRNSQEFVQMQAPAATRLMTVNQEIAVETRRPTPNPLELGLRYQEVETICREQDGPMMTAHQKQRQILTDEQRALLPALSESQRLSSLASIAAGLFLLPPPSIANLLLGINTPASIFPGSTIPVELALYLNFTPGQAERLQSSLLAHQRFVAARNSRTTELHTELEAEFRRDVPAPRELGDRYAELESIRRQLAERETSLRRELREMLTPQQRGLTEALERSQNLAGVSSTAQQYQLLPPQARSGAASIANAVPRGSLLFASIGLPPEFAIQRGCESGLASGAIWIDLNGDAEINASVSRPRN